LERASTQSAIQTAILLYITDPFPSALILKNAWLPAVYTIDTLQDMEEYEKHTTIYPFENEI